VTDPCGCRPYCEHDEAARVAESKRIVAAIREKYGKEALL
jgi:hypothetical protein